MWSEQRNKSGELLGYFHRRQGVLFYFGSRHLQREMLAELFPQFEFCFLKQVHGKKIEKADPKQIFEADGHWTDKKGQALVIQTADCLPLLVSTPGKIAAVHAGWRGLEAGIIGELKPEFLEASTFCLGPYIHKESFEVGLDVANRIKSSLHSKTDICLPHPDQTKSYVDLEAVAEAQIRESFGGDAEFHSIGINTFTNKDFASYRLSQGTKERQWSFIVID